MARQPAAPRLNLTPQDRRTPKARTNSRAAASAFSAHSPCQLHEKETDRYV